MKTTEHIGLWLLAAGMLLVAIVGGGLISGNREAILITGIVGITLASFAGMLCLPGLVAGFGLAKHCSWARWLSLVLAILDLVLVPLGTLFGAYAIWVLMQDDAIELFSTPCC